jgi:hypothetical protein
MERMKGEDPINSDSKEEKKNDVMDASPCGIRKKSVGEVR